MEVKNYNVFFISEKKIQEKPKKKTTLVLKVLSRVLFRASKYEQTSEPVVLLYRISKFEILKHHLSSKRHYGLKGKWNDDDANLVSLCSSCRNVLCKHSI